MSNARGNHSVGVEHNAASERDDLQGQVVDIVLAESPPAGAGRSRRSNRSRRSTIDAHLPNNAAGVKAHPVV